MTTRNQIPGVDDTRPTSASHSSGARTTLPSAPSEENNRNRTPSRAALVAASSRGFDGKGVNGRASVLPGSLAGGIATDAALLDLIADTVREMLQRRRGEVLTDALIEDRARNAAMAVAHVLDVALDEDTSPV